MSEHVFGVGQEGSTRAGLRRSGVVIAVSSGLMASMAVPASAAPHRESGGPQTASVPLVGAASANTASANAASVNAASGAFLGVPAGGFLAMPTELADSDQAVTAPASAKVQFDPGALTAVPKKHKHAATPVQRTRVPDRVSRSSTRVAPADTASGDDTSDNTKVISRVKSTTVSDSPVNTHGSSALAIAARYVGIPYRFGGTTPRGFDCSGYVQYVFGQLGVQLPRTTSEQLNAVRRVSRSEARPGDLVFFIAGDGASHVGIFAGGGLMYDSPRSGKSVSLREIWSGNVAYGRVI